MGVATQRGGLAALPCGRRRAAGPWPSNSLDRALVLPRIPQSAGVPTRNEHPFGAKEAYRRPIFGRFP